MRKQERHHPPASPRRFLLGPSLLGLLHLQGCLDDRAGDVSASPKSPAPAYTTERDHMVDATIAARGVRDPRVLDAMRAVPRHRFVPAGVADLAYSDNALPIEAEQTISQPYIVALMSEALELDFDAEERPRVLEVGTGSGYQAAVLDAMGAEVWSIEIVDELARSARERLQELGYERVRVRSGDGYRGWPEEAPFDAIIVTAAPPTIPEPLKQQLRDGGRLVLPVGDRSQELLRLTRRGDAFDEELLAPVRFVPMTGEIQSVGRDR